jgi:hypothetical protein
VPSLYLSADSRPSVAITTFDALEEDVPLNDLII